MLLALGVAYLRRPRDPAWSMEADGWAHSYVKAPNGGPIYVRRQVAVDHCLFGDFPESGELPVVRVGCGEPWTGSEGLFSLTCVCARQ